MSLHLGSTLAFDTSLGHDEWKCPVPPPYRQYLSLTWASFSWSDKRVRAICIGCSKDSECPVTAMAMGLGGVLNSVGSLSAETFIPFTAPEGGCQASESAHIGTQEIELVHGECSYPWFSLLNPEIIGYMCLPVSTTHSCQGPELDGIVSHAASVLQLVEDVRGSLSPMYQDLSKILHIASANEPKAEHSVGWCSHTDVAHTSAFPMSSDVIGCSWWDFIKNTH